MSSHFLAQSLLLCLLVYADFAYSKVHYIRPLLDSPCPQNASSCLTLSQFAANSSHNETDISLLFLRGNHTLERELLLAQRHNFSMGKYAKDNEHVFVECISQLGRFDISEATSVSIKSLHFIGCGSNRVSQVTWLTIANSIFRDVEDNSAVLELNGVDIANIERSQFLYNTIDYHTIYNISKFNFLKVHLDYIYYHRNRPGCVLYTVFSNVSIISSWFMYNKADIGGALVAHNSSVHIDRSTLSYNTAYFGGAMVTSASTIDTDSCTFTGNIAHVGGGVMVTYNDKFILSNTNFTQNIAYFGSVMNTFGNSSVAMNNCNCTSNNAKHIGVMVTWQNSLLNISNSTFTSNNAKDYGGVMVICDNSLIISNSTFSSNLAITSSTIEVCDNSLVIISHSTFTSISDSAVIEIFRNSVVNISNSTFINNRAVDIIYCTGKLLNLDSCNFSFNTLVNDGGIIQSSQCSTHIVNCVFDHNVGSLVHAYNSNLTLSGESKFENSNKVLITDDGFSQGGVITSYLSTVVFARYSTIYISSNQAGDGGAILAIESTIIYNAWRNNNSQQ